MPNQTDEEIERDLRPFADPATDVRVTIGSETARANLIRDGKAFNVSLDLKAGRSQLNIDGQHGWTYSSFRSMLASEHFAHVRQLAENQRRVLGEFMAKPFIEPDGSINGNPINLDRFKTAIELKRTDDAIPLRLTLIDGPAGVGKTSLIKRMVGLRADGHSSASNEPPILHVANRGRRLVSLDELIALSIQLVRAKFTYDQVPALVKHGVIQIAIDGFDELVDADGYADAWAVLRDFLNDIGNGGPILIAGRDTFFELTGFREKLGDLGARVGIDHASLAAITPRAAREWLAKAGWSDEDLESEDAEDLLKPNSYVLRPYFLSVIAELGGIDALLDTLIEPREYLVGQFMRREARIIVEKVPIDEDTAQKLLYELFELIASEMADSETEAVDLPFLQLAVEVVFGKALSSPNDLAKLRHKAGSFALMEGDTRADFRRFPHTEISNHFLAISLVNRILAGETPRFLRRNYIGSDFLRVFGELLLDVPLRGLADLRVRLGSLAKTDVGFERLSENSCSLLITSLVANWDDEPITIESLSAGEAVLFGEIGPTTLTSLSISRLDCRGVDLSLVEFKNCSVGILVADKDTRFADTLPAVTCLFVEENGTAVSVYEPSRISDWLASVSAGDELEETITDEVRELRRICRVFMRQFYIKDDVEEKAGRLLQSDAWRNIEKLLRKYDRVRRTDRKDASGRPGEFVHIINAQALLEQQTREDVEIWRELANVSSSPLLTST